MVPSLPESEGLKVASLTTGMLVLLSHTSRRACHSCVHCRRLGIRVTQSVWLMLVTVLRFTWSALGCDLAVIVQSISAS